MENRKKLHDCGLALVIVGILNLFMFISTVVEEIVDGSFAEALATVEADILVAVKIVLGIVFAILALLVFADVLLGIKALKVSKKPNASKGYITIAKIFLVLSCIAVISHVISIFSGNASAIDSALNVANATLSVSVYTLYVIAAGAVRKDFLNENK